MAIPGQNGKALIQIVAKALLLRTVCTGLVIIKPGLPGGTNIGIQTPKNRCVAKRLVPWHF